MPTSSSGLGYGSGFSRTPLITLKIAVFAPIPSAIVNTATDAKPAVRDRRRMISRRCWNQYAIRRYLVSYTDFV